MKKLVKCFVYIMSLVLVACNTAPKLSYNGKKDLVFKFESFKYITHFGLIDPDSMLGKVLSNPGKTQIDGVHEYRRYWCTKLSKQEMQNYTQQLASKHCQEMQGIWADKWCKSQQDEPLFFVDGGNLNYFKDSNDGHLPYCTAGNVYAVVAATSEDANPEAWRKRAKNTYGFLHKDELLAIKQAQVAKKNAAEQEKQMTGQYNALMIKNRGLGKRVCKNAKPGFYTGIVRAFDVDRIQIAVEAKIMGGSYRDTSFIPALIWDQASKWEACDSKQEAELLQ